MERAKFFFLQFIRKLQLHEDIQIAGIYAVIFVATHPHIHALLLGQKRDGRSLRHLGQEGLSRIGSYWPYEAKIEFVGNQKAAAAYIGFNLSGHPNSECFFYNLKLLKRQRLLRSQPVSPSNNSLQLDIQTIKKFTKELV